MSYCTDEVYSHPDKLLQEHLSNVAETSRRIFSNLDVNQKDLYSHISFLIGLTHDFAKCTSFFQNHLFNDVHSSNAYHSFLSSILCYHVIKEYLSKEKYQPEINLPLIGYLVVKNHHGNLKNIADEHEHFKLHNDDVNVQVEDIKNRNLDSLKSFYLNHGINIDNFIDKISMIKQDLKKELFKYKREKVLKKYVYLILFFSVLIDSDKMDASNSEITQRRSIDKDIVDNFKQENNFNQNGINKIREEAYEELTSTVEKIDLKNKLYSVSLPTGSGKTMTVFSFAMKLRNRIHEEKGILPRIIYSLPFLSIIDQNEEVIKNILSTEKYNSQDFFIKHNSMSELYYKTKDENELDIDNAEILIESWYSEIVITTFYQLLYTLISNKNRSLKKLHNLNNAIIIMDEVQSLPPKYWRMLNVLLKTMAEEYNFWIIFMTATQPAIYSKEDMEDLIKHPDHYYAQFDRVTYNFNLNRQTIDEFNEYVLNEILCNDKDIMIVVNTIQNSIDIFNYLSNNLVNMELYYLSTNILPFECNERIQSIRNSENKKVIVTTQLIEAGVDIDVDTIYRDFAPIDSIVQTGGRCNRNQQREKGNVNIIRLINEDCKEYNSYIYDSISRETTYELIKDLKTITEKEFYHTIGEYYNKINEKISNDDSNEILNNLTKLEINNITNEFSLIEDNIEKKDIFVDINQESHNIWKKYEDIIYSKMDIFTKKREFKKIRSIFRKYIISIDVKKIGTNPIEHDICYIDPSEIDHKYDKQLGFVSADDEEAFII